MIFELLYYTYIVEKSNFNKFFLDFLFLVRYRLFDYYYYYYSSNLRAHGVCDYGTLPVM